MRSSSFRPATAPTPPGCSPSKGNEPKEIRPSKADMASRYGAGDAFEVRPDLIRKDLPPPRPATLRAYGNGRRMPVDGTGVRLD